MSKKSSLRLTQAVKARFWSNVHKTRSCWLWKAGKITAGYGEFCLGKGKRIYAHRLAWIISHGPIPVGLYVCHNCPSGDEPSCVNPNHLFLGTPKDNVHDARDKGRLWKQAATLKRLWKEKWHKTHVGESNPKHKLTNKQVLEMRRLHADEGWGYKRLHRHFSVSFGVAQRIINRKSWKHI